MSPDEAAAYLAEIAYHLRGKEDQHRARAFSKVAASFLRDRPDLDALNRAGKLESLPGVGAGIAKVLRELVNENRSAYLERLREESGEPAAVPAQLTPLVEQGYQGDPALGLQLVDEGPEEAAHQPPPGGLSLRVGHRPLAEPEQPLPPRGFQGGGHVFERGCRGHRRQHAMEGGGTDAGQVGRLKLRAAGRCREYGLRITHRLVSV